MGIPFCQGGVYLLLAFLKEASSSLGRSYDVFRFLGMSDRLQLAAAI